MCETKLTFPGFSAVFIQTFSIHHTRHFVLPGLPPGALKPLQPHFDKERNIFVERADELDVPIAMAGRDIEHQIFILHSDKAEEERNVRRYSMRGFDFEMPLDGGLVMKGHCNVEMSLLFGHAVSLTYRFLFDGFAGTLSGAATTDDIISLLSIWLGAEFWSRDSESGEEDKHTDINLESRFIIKDLHITEDGSYDSAGELLDISSKGRYFDKVALRYKLFIYHHCTAFNDASKPDKTFRFPTTVENDFHYAMVDLWENLQHIGEDGKDYFSNKNQDALTEAEIVSHIRDAHKSELIGLLTLYPEEWPYRDPSAYDEVCGENIAIDTDDLVLCGSSLCMVLGTYGRRGADTDGVDWIEHLQERKRYHVSWPEYLVILQMVLAKKYIVGNVIDRLIESTAEMSAKSPGRLIRDNAELSLRLSRMILQLDVVKLSKFPSHKVMYDRTTRRLGLDEDMDRLSDLMRTVDSSLHNISDSKSYQSNQVLSMTLAFISVVSAFELFFVDTSMPFLSLLGIRDSSRLSAVTVFLVAIVVFVAIVYLVTRPVKYLFDRKNQSRK